MFQTIKNFFLQHPENVGMTYKEHMLFSFHLSTLFFKAGIKSIVHGIFPEIYITSSTDTSKELIHLLNHRNKL